MGIFDNKVVIVTGAGGGIGRCHALAFAKEGAKVVVNDLGGARDGSNPSEGMAKAVAEEIIQMGGQAVADGHSVATREGAAGIMKSALDAFGRIDVLVNNAGILRDRTLRKMTDDEYDSVMAVHMRGTYLCTQLACQHMIEQGDGGTIVNTSSTSGIIGNFGQSNYGAAKSGIAGFGRTVAMEMKKYNIRINAIAPVAKTRMTEELPQVSDELSPEFISPTVLYLASHLSDGVTGRVFLVYGNQIQEFYYERSEGATKNEKSPWTLDEIHGKWEQIVKHKGS